jgi:hypothetical protein
MTRPGETGCLTCDAHLWRRQAAAVCPCPRCPHPKAHYYPIGDRLLHICQSCWRWQVADLDTRNIPTTEEAP